MQSSIRPLRTVAAFVAVATLATACRDTAAPIPSRTPGATVSADRQRDAQSGTFTLCKQAGAGVAAGDPFTFRVTLTGIARVLTVAAGSCLNLEVPRESSPTGKGSYANTPTAVTRLLPVGSKLVVDDGQLSSAGVGAILTGASNVSAPSVIVLNLAQQLITADLNVLRGVQPSDAVAQAIADANAGITIAVGTNLVISTTLTTAQVGELVNTLGSFNAGKTARPATPLTVGLPIVELIEGLSQVSAIECNPTSACTNADVAAGSVTATVTSGATTTVTYTNLLQSGIRVCKVAGAGVEAGTVFSINATLLGLSTYSHTFAVPAGECRSAAAPSGSYIFQETIPTGYAVTSITCDPASCGSPILVDGVITGSVVDNAITKVTYTNRSTLGTLRVCKVAGSGVTAGTVYRITATLLGLHSATVNFDVPAGDCREASTVEGSYILQEVIPENGVVTSITCDPADKCGTPILADGVVTLTLQAQAKVTVTYTNSIGTSGSTNQY
jgi:hypothetical protein